MEVGEERVGGLGGQQWRTYTAECKAPGEPHGQRSLGHSPRGPSEADTTEVAAHTHVQNSYRPGGSCIAGGFFTSWAIREAPWNRQLVGTSCMAQGAQLGAPWWPRGEGDPRGRGYMYTYSWFTSLYSRQRLMQHGKAIIFQFYKMCIIEKNR